jgi:hypothetical protein
LAITPRLSMKRGRQLLNQVSTDLGEGHYTLVAFNEITKGVDATGWARAVISEA